MTVHSPQRQDGVDPTVRGSEFASDFVNLSGPESYSEGAGDRNFVTALARGLELLRCFGPGEGLLGNQELAAKSGLPKATVSRLTHTLAKLGFLKKQPQSGKYQLDVGVLSFGHQMLSNLSIRSVAHPFMEELSSYAKAAVAMAARDRLKMVYLDVVQSQASLTMRRQIGSQLPLHASSVGRACLAAMPDHERDFILDHLRTRTGTDWLTIRRSLERAFKDYSDFGYCFSLGDWSREVNSVAVPLVHPEHGILAFNCGGPSFLLSREALEDDIGPRLKHMVMQIEVAAG
jgi:DNA-binding IclR family transcriptional regulator